MTLAVVLLHRAQLFPCLLRHPGDYANIPLIKRDRIQVSRSEGVPTHYSLSVNLPIFIKTIHPPDGLISSYETMAFRLPCALVYPE